MLHNIFHVILVPFGTVIGIMVLLVIAFVMIPLMLAETYKMARRGDLKRQRDLRFSNTLYLCENGRCDRKFFRMYQVFEAYKSNRMAIPGETNLNELTYSQNVRIQWAEKMGICRCPDCGTQNVKRTRQFDWMDAAPAFPKLDRKELTERRRQFANPGHEKQMAKALEDIRETIDELDSIAAYQLQYDIASDAASDQHLTERLQGIQQQLQLFRQTTPYASTRQTAAELLRRLGVDSTDRFAANPLPVANPSERDIELQGALEAIKHAEKCVRTDNTIKRPRNYLDMERVKEVDEVTRKYFFDYYDLRNDILPIDTRELWM